MYALMHIGHLSVCYLETFSDPLAVHTFLSVFPISNHTAPQERRCSDSRQQETNGEPRHAFERRLCQGERSAEKNASSHKRAEEKRLVHSYSPPTQCFQKKNGNNQGHDKDYVK